MEVSAPRVNETSIDYLNTFLPNKAALYNILDTDKKYFLPSFGSKAVTTEYLLSVAKEEVFTIKREKIKQGKVRKSICKSELIGILNELAGSKPLGFNEERAPNKKWLVSCIYTLNPNHSIFGPPPVSSFIPKELPENFFENLSFPLKRFKGRRFFMKTPEERERMRIAQNEKALQRKSYKIQKIKMKLQELEKDLAEENEKEKEDTVSNDKDVENEERDIEDEERYSEEDEKDRKLDEKVKENDCMIQKNFNESYGNAQVYLES